MLKELLQKSFAIAGLRVTRLTAPPQRGFPSELTEEDQAIFHYVRDNRLSIVSDEALYTTIMACTHVAQMGVEGDFVECGVYRGGNAILAADVFRRRAPQKSTWLYDTFSGMTEPGEVDVSIAGAVAKEKFEQQQRKDHNAWQYASIEDVRENFDRAGLLAGVVRFVEGDILQTLKSTHLPAAISVLRLDTDWYESTKVELEVLYPRLANGGILIIDDYGSWQGSKKAVDEYFTKTSRPFLQYSDTTRVGVKQG